MRLLFAILLLSAAAFADDALSHLRADYQSKIFLLRGFYQDSLLRYDAAGQLKHRAEAGPWTTAFVLIKSVDSKNGKTTLKASRVVQIFDPKKQIFVATRINLPVVIEIEADSGNDAVLRQALATVFIPPREPLVPLVPDYWRNVIERIALDGKLLPEPKPDIERSQCDPAATIDKPCYVGSVVRAPKMIATPDPDYTELARSFKFPGNRRALDGY